MSMFVIQIERLVELSSNLAIKEWRRLPHIVTHIHVPLLQVSKPPHRQSNSPLYSHPLLVRVLYTYVVAFNWWQNK